MMFLFNTNKVHKPELIQFMLHFLEQTIFFGVQYLPKGNPSALHEF